VSTARRAAAGVLAVALLGAGCGGDPGAEPASSPHDPFEHLTRARPAADPPARAAPRWEQIVELSGEGPASERFPVAEDALQWRLTWTCAQGRLRVAVDGDDEPLVDAACPADGEAFAIQTGFLDVDVAASGPWQLAVEQQVDSVYEEPPLDGMDPDAVVAAGSFYSIERSGQGTATLYRLADGRLALRLGDGFQTLASPDLHVWLSHAERPATSAEIFAAERVDLGAITTTYGDHNYLLPAGVDVKQIRSVVIWCVPVQIAYTAAALRR